MADAEDESDRASVRPESSEAGSIADSDDEDFEVHSSAAEASSASSSDSDEPPLGSEDMQGLQLDSGAICCA